MKIRLALQSFFGRPALDVGKVKRTIVAVENRTSGEIRVSVAPFFWGSVLRTAQRAFTRLGMERTRDRNGVLLFIVPSRRAFVLLGDVGIHERVGEQFWNRLAREMGPLFHEGDFTEGVVHAITVIGAELAKYFPADPSRNPNELPDSIDWGQG